MKLVAQVKLNVTRKQHQALLETLEITNDAANYISQQSWNTGTFRQYDMHHLLYYDIRSRFKLTAQIVVRVLAKVADTYKLGRKTIRIFNRHGSIAYDKRILSWKLPNQTVSIWTVDGRLKIPFVVGTRQLELLKSLLGEADLVYRDGIFYLKGIRSRITVRKSQRRQHHSWSFSQLGQFIQYKARLSGVLVIKVDPRYTSQVCPVCGTVDKRNRPSQAIFSCVSCGFSSIADTVAAGNIASRAACKPARLLARPGGIGQGKAVCFS